MSKRFFVSIKAEIKRARRILVCAHVNPDPDAVGSALALARILKRSGKRVTIFIAGFSPVRYEGLPGIEEINRRLPREQYDLVFALDYGKFHRLSIAALFNRPITPRLVTIDHHPQQDQQGDVVWVDIEKSSVAEMIYDLAKALAFQIDGRTAHSILFGIVGDTVGLSTPSSTPALLMKVIDLMKLGGSLTKTQALIQEWSSPKLMKLAAQALLRAEIIPRKSFAYSWVGKNEWRSAGVEPDALSFIANDLRMIRGVRVSLLLVEQGKKWHGHLRSRAESRRHLGKIAERFGGGGHVHASGFETKMSRNKIVKTIINTLPNRR